MEEVIGQFSVSLEYAENTQAGSKIVVIDSDKREVVESLNGVLPMMLAFLQSIGFTYVSNLIAVTDGGNEFRAHDL